MLSGFFGYLQLVHAERKFFMQDTGLRFAASGRGALTAIVIPAFAGFAVKFSGAGVRVDALFCSYFKLSSPFPLPWDEL